MQLDKRLVVIGIMVIVLSVTMATQYATTKVGYSYSIVHPSNADIRFIASDNATDGIMILRVSGNNDSGARALTLKLGGNWTENFNKTYTAAFGIVNEENLSVNITYINVSTTTGLDYMQIWVHGDRDLIAGSDGTSVMVWDKGTLDEVNTAGGQIDRTGRILHHCPGVNAHGGKYRGEAARTAEQDRCRVR